VDGKFGPKTKAAVIAYQKANKIPSTGFVGPLTFASINKGITALNTETNTNTNTGNNTSQKLAIKNTSPLPPGTVGVPYELDIEGVGGAEGYNNWEIVSGKLPPGILLTVTAIRCIKAPCYNFIPARISGTPTESGNYGFIMKVTSGDEEVQKILSLEILNSTATSSGGGSSAGSTGVVCEYAHPPTGYHYENMKTYPPCGATLTAD
jgi:peptidoglycan hydrolase-like protein with peptidoglycan-binding domain